MTDWLVSRATGQLPYPFYDMDSKWIDDALASKWNMPVAMWIASTELQDKDLFQQIPRVKGFDGKAFEEDTSHLLMALP